MDNLNIKKIDTLIDSARSELASLTIKLVNIKSDLQPPLPGAPFGEGVRKVLDTVLEMGSSDGMYTYDYNTGVISIGLKEGQPDLGIWVHGDVVPAGDGWEFQPYNAVEYEGRIIGRGGADNKGQLAAMYILLKIFKQLGIELNYNPALYVGSNEEKGMLELLGREGNDDAKGFLNICTPPKLSLVPDGAFPVGYCGKGNLTVYLKTKKPLKGFRLTAGHDDAPGKAAAFFPHTDLPENLPDCVITKAKNTVVEAFSPPVHTAHPDPSGNMITKLSKALLDTDHLYKYDETVLGFLKTVSSDTEGKFFDINVETSTMTPLSLSAYRIDDIDGCPELYVNIRYPIEITLEKILENIAEKASEYGFEISRCNSIHKPYLLDKNHDIVKTLCEISNGVIGVDKPPYTLGGGTYAHELPNAYVFGSSANFPPEAWPKGKGNAHGIDEAVSLDRLQKAMKIYARALLALNETEW